MAALDDLVDMIERGIIRDRVDVTFTAKPLDGGRIVVLEPGDETSALIARLKTSGGATTTPQAPAPATIPTVEPESEGADEGADEGS
jgi:hypothetical protein